MSVDRETLISILAGHGVWLDRCDDVADAVLAAIDADAGTSDGRAPVTTATPEMLTAVERVAELLLEVYKPGGALIFWSARIKYLEDRRPCDIYRDGDVEAMQKLAGRINAICDGAVL